MYDVTKRGFMIGIGLLCVIFVGCSSQNEPLPGVELLSENTSVIFLDKMTEAFLNVETDEEKLQFVRDLYVLLHKTDCRVDRTSVSFKKNDKNFLALMRSIAKLGNELPNERDKYHYFLDYAHLSHCLCKNGTCLNQLRLVGQMDMACEKIQETLNAVESVDDCNQGIDELTYCWNHCESPETVILRETNLSSISDLPAYNENGVILQKDSVKNMLKFLLECITQIIVKKYTLENGQKPSPDVMVDLLPDLSKDGIKGEIIQSVVFHETEGKFEVFFE